MDTFLFIALPLVIVGLLVTTWLQLRRRVPFLFEPESANRVTADAGGITWADPKGRTRQVAWTALRRVSVRTNDRGPLDADVFWELATDDDVLSVPGGAAGIGAMLGAFGERLPGFDFERVAEALTSVEDASFKVWEGRARDGGV